MNNDWFNKSARANRWMLLSLVRIGNSNTPLTLNRALQRRSLNLLFVIFMVAGCLLLPCRAFPGEAAKIADISITFKNLPISPWQTLPPEVMNPSDRDSKEHGPLANIVAGHIAGVAVTWLDAKQFKSQSEAQQLLRELLNNTNTLTWTYHVWSFADAEPSLIAIVQHSVGKEGKWLVWASPSPGVYWAYQDGSSKWWWGMRESLTTPVNSRFDGFPVVPPIADVDPTHRSPVAVRIPTAMQSVRHGDSLTISFPSLQATNLMVGHKMVTGVTREEYVHSMGVTQRLGMSLQGGLAFESSTNVFTLSSDAIPRPGQEFIFEYRVTMFETDLPGQHMWSPQSGKHYKVLWRQTFKETIR